MKKAIRILVALLVIGGIIAAVVWKLSDNKKVIQEQSQLAQDRNDVIPVKTKVLKRISIQADFESSGTFQPYKELNLISDVQGLDKDLLQNQLEIAKVNLQKADNDLGRLKNLLGDGGVTKQQVADAELAVENLKAQIRGLDKQLTLTVIKAPISGTVTGKTVEKGAYIGAGMPILNLVNVRRLKFQTFLREEEVFQVKKGQRIELSADMFPERKFTGEVTYIDIKADNSKRYLVEVELENPGGNLLKGGMNGHSKFSSGQTATFLALPRESVVGSIRDAHVFVVEGGVAKLKPVQLGNIYGDIVEIESGLNEGEVIVVAGQINLAEGTKVEAEELTSQR
ncbi:MAG: efflux RND transporter periplasmic adaptor subunit [Saprospirales bacterium]|nr:efflux RND transporter periplasmic adaptor subunit [Saprospirales bacterium]